MMSSRSAILVSAALLAGTTACGLRSTSDAPQLCADTDDGGGTDTEGEARFLSCEDPLYVPNTPGIRVEGVVGGCGDTQGWCEANGGEDYFQLLPLANPYDVTIRFDPDATDFEPFLRIMEVPTGGDPCEEVEARNEPVCAQVSDDLNPRAFLLRPGFDTYVVVDARAGDSGNYAFELDFGIGPANEVDCLVDLEEQTIDLGLGGVFNWNGNLSAGGGVLSGQCGGPGEEDVFTLNVNQPGTITATVTADGADPVLSVRAGCASGNELACDMAPTPGSSTITLPFAAAGTAYLWVDQLGVDASSYNLEVRLD